MMKVLIMGIAFCCGTFLIANDSAPLIDEYYASLDLEEYTVAEYSGKINFDNGGTHEVDRKRSHRRKRIIRPPARGK